MVREYFKPKEITLGGKKIAVVHYPEKARALAESGKYEMVFYGHTHKPWEERIGQCRLVNPGELAGQRQSRAQLRQRWGDCGAAAILNNAATLLVLTTSSS